jgi:hypothetical protein
VLLPTALAAFEVDVGEVVAVVAPADDVPLPLPLPFLLFLPSPFDASASTLLRFLPRC